MTATVDMLVLREICGTENTPVYEPSWLFVSYANTGGLWRMDTPPEEYKKYCKGQIIDALLGDGPARYGLTSARSVSLIDFHQGRPYSADEVDCYTVTRCSLTEYLQESYRNRHTSVFQALSLIDFVPFVVHVTNTTSALYESEQTRAMNYFLQGLVPEKHIVLPIIGQGLYHSCTTIYSVCGFRGGILDATMIQIERD